MADPRREAKTQELMFTALAGIAGYYSYLAMKESQEATLPQPVKDELVKISQHLARVRRLLS